MVHENHVTGRKILNRELIHLLRKIELPNLEVVVFAHPPGFKDNRNDQIERI